jgi:glycosyltransferase involved in cell wall biosynthesis
VNAHLITVLITTHNYGQFIEEAIDSVLSQDLSPDQLEVLVVDDGSTDDTSERVKKYGASIRYVYKPNGGQASALNFGIERASGEIVALLDADDQFLPGKLSRIVEVFQQHPNLGMAYHRLLEWHMQTGERREWPFSPVSGDIHKIPNDFLLYVPQPTSCIAFRRSALKPLLPIPEDVRMLADCFLVALIPFVSPILAIPEFLALYRIHGNNSFSTIEQQIPLKDRKRKLQMWQILIPAMCNWLVQNGHTRKQPPVRDFLNRWIFYQLHEQILVKPPGRMEFFWFLVRENHLYSHNQTYKLTAYNYATAALALLFGYKNRNSMYEWRRRGLAVFESMFKTLRSALPKTEGR